MRAGEAVVAGKGDTRRPEAEPGLFNAGFEKLDWLGEGTKMTDKAFALWAGAVMVFFLALAALGVFGARAVLPPVTLAQRDSALVEAAYRLLSERDSVIRECVATRGPLDPRCRP